MNKLASLALKTSFWKKNLVISKLKIKHVVEFDHSSLSVREQCKLLKINRSSLYYEVQSESIENLKLMSMLDKLSLKFPFAGSRMLRDLLYQEGHIYNRKRIQRLRRLMGIEAIYPKKNLSSANSAHKKFPYLLKNLEITHPNHVWGADITYIPMAYGFLYLFAIID